MCADQVHSSHSASGHPLMEQSEEGLSCRSLSVYRGRKRVLNKVSVDLRPGEVLGILGANGAGKSTLLSTLAGDMGIDPALHLRCPVTLNGRDITGLTAAELARSRAVLPQKPGLSFDLGVDEVVSMGLYPFPELTGEQCQEVLEAAVSRTEISSLESRRYPELSGGEQQRVQFARVLTQLLAARLCNAAAAYLLLDEPSSSLDPAHQHALLRITRRVASEDGAGVLVVLHDVNLAAQYCDRIALIAEGGVLSSGRPPDVLRPELLQRVYGAPVHVQAHPVHAEVPLIVFL